MYVAFLYSFFSEFSVCSRENEFCGIEISRIGRRGLRNSENKKQVARRGGQVRAMQEGERFWFVHVCFNNFLYVSILHENG